MLIEEVTVRNKSNACDNVLSVSNKMGFIKQSEQFEDRQLRAKIKAIIKLSLKGALRTIRQELMWVQSPYYHHIAWA